MKKLPSSLTIVSTSLLLLSCQTPKHEDEAPITIAFDHNSINKEYNIDVNIEKPNTYSVEMQYYLEKPKEYKLFSSKKVTAKSIEDSDKLGEILGLRYEDTFRDLGAPAKYRVKIYDKQKGKYIMDEIIHNPKTNGISSGRYATLASLYLLPGNYSIYVVYLSGSVRLNNLYTQLEFTTSHHGK